MKLGTMKDGSRDGHCIVVSRDNQSFISARPICSSLQDALDRWDTVEPKLKQLSDELNRSSSKGEKLKIEALHSPLPRAYEWVDGSAYIKHIMLVRKARGAEPPETLRTDPLVYQGGSGTFLGPTDAIPFKDKAWGLDFESEVCVVLGDTPMGTKKDQAGPHVRLVMLANDVSLRGLIPVELAKGFGFFNSKPATAYSPFAVTPDELGSAWQDGRLHLPLRTTLNGTLFGDPNAGPEMFFSFYELIEHICKTRSFTAGTILGSGTVSNEDRARGSSCIVERRTLEKIESGVEKTPYLGPGDHVHIEMLNASGHNIFGAISQKVVAV